MESCRSRFFMAVPRRVVASLIYSSKGLEGGGLSVIEYLSFVCSAKLLATIDSFAVFTIPAHRAYLGAR